MKIIQVQNHPRQGGGADVLFSNVVDLLRKKGQKVIPLTRSSRDLRFGLFGRFHAFTSGLYSRPAYNAMMQLIRKENPDIVHVHDLFPLLVWVLRACGDADVPVVMTCHNYRFTCPTNFHFKNGKVCERCVDGHEHWCILNNCRKNIFESAAYALHNVVARWSGLFLNNVTLFIALTNFSRNRLQAAGVPGERLVVLPNMMVLPACVTDNSKGSYVAYIGRFGAEKGIDVLLSAAAHNPDVPVWLAGDYAKMPELFALAPQNVKFVGRLDRLQVANFYKNSRFIVVPSRWFEVCPMTIIESMSYGLPVIASRIGSLKEMIDDRLTGILFETGNVEDLASKIRMLWDDRGLCRQMGLMARDKAVHEYNGDVYYNKLITLYHQAIQMKKSDLDSQRRPAKGEVARVGGNA